MQTLETRRLGKSGIETTSLGMGLWAIGGHWGPTDDAKALSAIDLALNEGINFFDTADVYGNGHSEELLGRAMRGRREKFLVGTKIGWTGYDGEKNQSAYDTVDKLIEGVEKGLRRLETDYVDLIQNHVPYREPNTDVFLEGFRKLKEQGKVRAIGISSSDFEFIKYFNRDGDCDSLQIDYSILNRTPEEEIFPYCQANNVGVIVRGGLAMGLLTGKFDADSTFADDDFRHTWIEDPEQNVQFLRDLETVEKLKEVAGERTLTHLALRFAMDHPAVSTVIAGARNPRQVSQNVVAMQQPGLSDAEREDINAIVPPGGGRKIWPA